MQGSGSRAVDHPCYPAPAHRCLWAPSPYAQLFSHLLSKGSMKTTDSISSCVQSNDKPVSIPLWPRHGGRPFRTTGISIHLPCEELDLSSLWVLLTGGWAITTREAGAMWVCLVMLRMKDRWIRYHRGCNSKNLLFKPSDSDFGRICQHFVHFTVGCLLSIVFLRSYAMI